MRAFVTGGTGFLGAHLVRHLLDQGDDVAILVRPASDRWRIADAVTNVSVISGDMGALSDVGPEVRAWSPDVLYHLAWEGVHGEGRDSTEHMRRNVCGALDLVALATQAGCRKWIGLGSQAEFGPTRERLHEDTAAQPVTPYGASKLAVGLLTAQLCHASGLKHAWLRLLSAYGPMDEPSYLIPYIIAELLAGRSPKLSEGSQPHDTLHARDVASALRRAAASPTCTGSFVLCSGRPTPVRTIATIIRDLAAPGTELVFGERGMVPVGLSGTPDALGAATGWTMTIDLEDGLHETVGWYRAAASGHAA